MASSTFYDICTLSNVSVACASFLYFQFVVLLTFFTIWLKLYDSPTVPVSIGRSIAFTLWFFARHMNDSRLQCVHVIVMIITKINVNYFCRMHRGKNESEKNQNHLSNLHFWLVAWKFFLKWGNFSIKFSLSKVSYQTNIEVLSNRPDWIIDFMFNLPRLRASNEK